MAYKNTYNLAGNLYVAVNEYREKILIHLRHYNISDETGELTPTTDGLAFKEYIWSSFLKIWPEIEQALEHHKADSADVNIAFGSKYSVEIQKQGRPGEILLTIGRKNEFMKLTRCLRGISWSICKLTQLLAENKYKKEKEIAKAVIQKQKADFESDEDTPKPPKKRTAHNREFTKPSIPSHSKASTLDEEKNDDDFQQSQCFKFDE